jgi:hypothetical protein
MSRKGKLRCLRSNRCARSAPSCGAEELHAPAFSLVVPLGAGDDERVPALFGDRPRAECDLGVARVVDLLDDEAEPSEDFGSAQREARAVVELRDGVEDALAGRFANDAGAIDHRGDGGLGDAREAGDVGDRGAFWVDGFHEGATVWYRRRTNPFETVQAR